MGTNFYARIIPSEERKNKLKKAIDNNDVKVIKDMFNRLYGEVTVDEDEPLLHYGIVHLGKRSSGWKFLWNPNVYEKQNYQVMTENGKTDVKRLPPTPLYVYQLNRNAIKEFIDREDVLIFDEYGSQWDKDDFFDMAINWGIPNGFDCDTYTEYQEKEGNTYYRYSCQSHYTVFLESLGYNLNTDKSEFYSDGLRFSSSCQFS